jgi:hypothetical protein
MVIICTYIPNVRKIFQIALNFFYTFSNLKPSKINLLWDFRFENKPSGNPGFQRMIVSEEKWRSRLTTKNILMNKHLFCLTDEIDWCFYINSGHCFSSTIFVVSHAIWILRLLVHFKCCCHTGVGNRQPMELMAMFTR